MKWAPPSLIPYICVTKIFYTSFNFVLLLLLFIFFRRKLIAEIAAARREYFEILKPRKETVETFVSSFMDAKVRPLWPPGWVRLQTLLKYSNPQSQWVQILKLAKRKKKSWIYSFSNFPNCKKKKTNKKTINFHWISISNLVIGSRKFHA